MRKTALLTLFTAGISLSSTAHAGLDIEDYGSVDSVTISSAVAVPLYTTPSGVPVPCVQVTIGEEAYLFGLDLGHGISVGSRVAADLGLELEEEEDKAFGTIKTAEIDKMAIGALELSGVAVHEMTPASDAAPAHLSDAGGSLDGWIGLATLDQVAWSIQPSTGQVVFAPLAEGPELVASLKEGSTFTWRETEMVAEKYGKKKKGVHAQAPIITATIGGFEGDAILTYSWWSSVIRSGAEVADAPSRSVRGAEQRWLPVQVGKQRTEGWVYTSGPVAGTLQLYTEPVFSQDSADGVVGARALAGLDIAADPASNSIALKAAAEQKREDPLPFLLQGATAAAEKMPTPPEGEAADPEAKPGSAAAWARVSSLQLAAGDLTAAIASQQKRLDYEGSEHDCTIYNDLGNLQLSAGMLDDAIASLNTAADLYHGWWDQDLETRQEIQEALGEFENDEEKEASEYADVHVQSGSCHTADGRLAMAWLGQGDLEKVNELYAERIDLDSGLAVIQGNAALIDGNLTLARSAYYRASMLEGHPSAASRLGQALVHESAGEWTSAEALYEKALSVAPHDVMAGQLWVDASIRAKSAAATTRATERLLASNPDSAAAFIAHARALRLAGDSGKLSQLNRQGDTFFDKQQALFPASGYLTASRALFLVETGRLADGQAMAEAALIDDPDAILAWIALGNVYVLSGDVTRGENMFKRAGQIGAHSPALALLINTDIPEPVVPEEAPPE